MLEKYTREELWKILKKKGQMDIGQIFHPYDYKYHVSSIKDGIHIKHDVIMPCMHGKQFHAGAYEMVRLQYGATSMRQSTLLHCWAWACNR
jgi:hypothetical protein